MTMNKEILVETLPAVQTALGPIEIVLMPWEQRSRLRRKCTTSSGTVVAFALARGTILTDGTLVYNSPEQTIQVRAEEEDVIVVSPANQLETCVVAHHLGNWHRSLQLNDDGSITIEFDSPLAHWLEHERIVYKQTRASYHPNLKGHSHD